MLGDKDAAANIAVKNLEAAKKFYEDTLGLTQVDVPFPYYSCNIAAVKVIVIVAAHAGCFTTKLTFMLGVASFTLVSLILAIAVLFKYLLIY